MTAQKPTYHDRSRPPANLHTLLANLVFPTDTYPNLPANLRLHYGYRLCTILNTVIDTDYNIILDAVLYGEYRTNVDQDHMKERLEEVLFIRDVESLEGVTVAKMQGAACPGLLVEGVDRSAQEDVLGRAYLQDAGELEDTWETQADYIL